MTYLVVSLLVIAGIGLVPCVGTFYNLISYLCVRQAVRRSKKPLDKGGRIA